jgi:hypothetical protein
MHHSLYHVRRATNMHSRDGAAARRKFMLTLKIIIPENTSGKDMKIEIKGMKIEEVSKTKYLGTTVTKDNLIEEEIKERIAAGNQASFANQKILQSKLISKKTKMK